MKNKKYSLYGVVHGEEVNFKKKFNTRNDAINYMFKYYDNKFVYGTEVEEVVEVSKHNIVYVCNDGNLFNVARI